MLKHHGTHTLIQGGQSPPPQPQSPTLVPPQTPFGVVHKLRSQSGGEVKEMSTFVYKGGGGGFVKSLRSFLGPIFFKKLYFYKGWLHDIFI